MNDPLPPMTHGEWATIEKTTAELNRKQAQANTACVRATLSIADFRAYMPMHNYIFVPSRELWPATSVNSKLQPIELPNGKKARPSDWLDEHQSVEQMSWAPGMPMLIEGKLISGATWIEHSGATCFNLYRPPQIELGDPNKAGPWIDHLDRIYPAEAEHIEQWFAHRVQFPGEKINHALLLGGAQGIGKDTLLEPVKQAVGPWNFEDVSPMHLLGRFNGFVKSVILRVSEGRDMGDVDRYAFYEHLKVFTAAPPDVLRCDEKHLREYSVMNVCGVIITTNHKTDGIYLPADDRRHFVAWSDATKDDFDADYWNILYSWYEAGGYRHVAAHLTTLSLSDFDPKAPPPKTPAFYDIVDANRAPEDAELADVVESMKHPEALTLARLVDESRHVGNASFADWLEDRKNRRAIPHRLEDAGYVPVRNGNAKDGLWKVGRRRQAIYGRKDLLLRDRLMAAAELTR